MLFLIKTKADEAPVIVSSTELKSPMCMLLEVCKKNNIIKIFKSDCDLLECDEGIYMVQISNEKYKVIEVIKYAGYLYGASVFIEDRFRLDVCDYTVLDSDEITDDQSLTMEELLLKVGEIKSH